MSKKPSSNKSNMEPYERLLVAEKKTVDRLVAFYETEYEKVRQFHGNLLNLIHESKDLSRHVHSIRERTKDPVHLRDKLSRKILKAKEEGAKFDIDEKNLFVRINDLSGIRILHLHTSQFFKIDVALRLLLDEQKLQLREGPIARAWDLEYRRLFENSKIKTVESPSLYTSVHYVIGSASRTLITSEIQVRTLMEEVWGEVDHSINYPHPVEFLACREQILALARITSGATRLVDSIFASHDDLKLKAGE